MSDPRTEIAELWRSLNREFHERVRQVCRNTDLPMGALLLLRVISRTPGVTVSELARHSGMVKSQVSKLVELLVHQGLAEKQADPSDQRLVRVYPKQSAMDSLPEMEARVQAAWAPVLDEIPQEQLAGVAGGLHMLLAAVEKAKRKVNKDA